MIYKDIRQCKYVPYLSYVLIQVLEYISKQHNNSPSNDNTLSIAVRSGNVKLLKKNISTGCIPNNINYQENRCHTTLTQAVKTKNKEIIRIVRQMGSESNSSEDEGNILYNAFLTYDPDILFEIIVHGGIWK